MKSFWLMLTHRGFTPALEPWDVRVVQDPQRHRDAPHFNGMPLEEVSRYLGHSSTDVTRRYARQTPDALGRRAAEALERSGLVAM